MELSHKEKPDNDLTFVRLQVGKNLLNCVLDLTLTKQFNLSFGILDILLSLILHLILER